MHDVGALVFVIFLLIAAGVLLPWGKIGSLSPTVPAVAHGEKKVFESDGQIPGEDLGPAKSEEFPDLEIDAEWSEQTTHLTETK